MTTEEKVEDLEVSEAELNDLPVTEEQATKTNGGISLNYTKVMLRTVEYDAEHKP